MDRTTAKEIFGAKDEWPDQDTIDRYIDFMEGTVSTLEERGYSEVVKPYRLVITDFLFEQVTLEETQTTLANTLKLSGLESLRSKYASFLDAPLGTDEQQVAASTTLCQILGGMSTFPLKKNYRIFEEIIRKITTTAEACWLPDQRRRFLTFMTTLTSPKELSMEEQRRSDLLEMAASESDLQELLKQLWQEKDK
ncbi:hypothetical protein FHL15_002642 [Xylaria flabelliformis]|uniref:Uncharacterized protein n=1 Tax=Xylaria flabelliformis TaxID=2512241 RepID=A0A553I835_9PEZI|nr:hypothetical protein FHL15_002642 [Xylaria flabelliformis]